MYYKFKILLYETGEILESSRFYAKRGNARRYLPGYCYGYVKLHEATQGRYSIQISSETGQPLYAVDKLNTHLYRVTTREGWREDAPLYVEFIDSNPDEL